MARDSFLEELDVNARFEAPPINNACVPDIYSKLDADIIEKTRVVNSLLDERLKVQEKVLNKYRDQAEKYYEREKDRIRQELWRVRRRMPNMSDFHPDVDTKYQIKKMRMVQSHIRTPIGYTTTPREIKGIPAEKDNRPFCQRFVSHHLPTKGKWNKDLPKLPRGHRRIGNVLPGRSKDKTRILLISRGLSASENCLAAGPFPSDPSDFGDNNRGVMNDNDDAMTI